MSNSSTRVVYNGSQVSIEAEVMAGTTHSADDAEASCSLTRYLSDANHHPPGYRPAQTITESTTRVLGELRKFEANFSSNRDAPSRN